MIDSMDRKIVMVTGGTSGIGYYTAQEIARMGATVVIVGRDEGKCLSSVEKIQHESGNHAVSYLLADLSSQRQIRSIARKFLDQHEHLDVLVNNAGGANLFRQVSEDGLERTFAVNHLAYFMLTNMLLDALKNSPRARVISVSSGSHYGEHIDFNDLQTRHFYNPVKAYGRSKLANILFAYELARRMDGKNVTSNALTPGMVATDIWKKVNPWLTPFIYPVVERIAQTPLQGAQTSIYLATSPEMERVTGMYYADKQPVRSSPESYNAETARRLWEVSAELVGLKDSA